MASIEALSSTTITMSSRQKINKIRKNLITTFRDLRNIPRPSPNASPNTRQSFVEMVTITHQAASRMSELASNMAEWVPTEDGDPIDLDHAGECNILKIHQINPLTLQIPDDILQREVLQGKDRAEDEDDGNENNGDETEDENTNLKDGSATEHEPGSKPTRQPTAKQQYKEIMNTIEDEETVYTIEDFRTMIIRGGYEGSVSAQEVTSLCRSLVGYKRVSADELKEIFHARSLFPSTSISHVTNNAIQIQDIADDTQRIMRREKLLFMGPANDQLGSWVRIVIRNVEAIKSIEDWETQTPASRKRFHLALAKEVNAEAFERLERIPYPSKVKKKETTKLVGPAVLLDPFLLQTTPKGYPMVRNTFGELVSKILDQYDQLPEEPCAHYWNDRKFLLRAVGFLGGDVVEDYIYDFLEETFPEEACSGDENESNYEHEFGEEEE
ncbi:hypothetical protein GG344DRAFT_78443 [Lentinula edodes]|nr:hypothetical protein GG344DRAFT_78443 [Lentinula edodes]